MKTNILLLVLFSCNLILTAQVPNWEWARMGFGAGHDYGKSISTDANGNSYTTGYFQVPSIDFGTHTLTGSPNFLDNVYLVKYDNVGNELWAKSATGENNAYGDCVNTDDRGNSYVSGRFQGTGIISFGNITLTNPSGFDQGFLVRYDSAGNEIWAKLVGTDLALGTNVTNTTDENGNVYVAFTTNQPNFSGIVLHVEKYDVAGNLVWHNQYVTDNFQDHITDICANNQGDICITGIFAGTSMIIGNDSLSNTNNGQIVFVAQLDAAGNDVWAKTAGTNSGLYEPSIGLDASGNAYITGYFNAPLTQFGNITLTNASGAEDIFLVKFDNQGNVAWAKRAGGNDFDETFDIVTDAKGNSYITGMFRATAYFDNLFVFSSGQPDVFVAKYDDTGNAIWVQKAGGTLADIAEGIAIDANGASHVTGHFFSKSIYFGTSILDNSDSVFMPADIFVAKLEDISTEISAASDNSAFTIFPNPFSEEAVMVSSETLNDAELSIYNPQGQLVRLIPNIIGKKIYLQRENLPSGLYFLFLKEGNHVFSEKIVITDK